MIPKANYQIACDEVVDDFLTDYCKEKKVNNV
jgi:hypothetical protein